MRCSCHSVDGLVHRRLQKRRVVRRKEYTDCVVLKEEFGESDLVLTPAGCGRAFDEAEDASVARARPFTPYGE